MEFKMHEASLIEQVLDDGGNSYGFTVAWRWNDTNHEWNKGAPLWCSVMVFDIEYIGEDGKSFYKAEDYDEVGANFTPDLDLAEVYISGFIKWDGCTELGGCPHWCSVNDYKKHIALLEYLYKKAREIMRLESKW